MHAEEEMRDYRDICLIPTSWFPTNHTDSFLPQISPNAFFYFKNSLSSGIEKVMGLSIYFYVSPENSDWSWIVCFQTWSLILWNLVCAITFHIKHKQMKELRIQICIQYFLIIICSCLGNSYIHDAFGRSVEIIELRHLN